MSDPSDMGPIEGQLCFNAYKLNRAFSRFYQMIFADTGLTYPKYVILNVLKEDGPLAVSQLSDRAGVEPNTLSPLLKRMAEFGVLARTRDTADERRVVIALTEMGEAALAAARQAVAAGFAQLDIDVNDAERSLAFSEEMLARLETADPPKLSFDAILREKQ